MDKIIGWRDYSRTDHIFDSTDEDRPPKNGGALNRGKRLIDEPAGLGQRYIIPME